MRPGRLIEWQPSTRLVDGNLCMYLTRVKIRCHITVQEEMVMTGYCYELISIVFTVSESLASMAG